VLLRVGGGGAGADKAAGVGKSNVGTYWPMNPPLLLYSIVNSGTLALEQLNAPLGSKCRISIRVRLV
jgi:hypothetical protein